MLSNINTVVYGLLAIFVVGMIVAIIRDQLGYFDEYFENPETLRKRLESEELARKDREKREEEQRAAAACEAARSKLRSFFERHETLFGDSFSKDELDAFIEARMSGDTEPATVWTACLEKIEALKVKVAEGREGQAYMLKIDADIAECRTQIQQAQQNLTTLNDDEGVMQDIARDKKAELQGLEQQKQLHIATNQPR